MTRIKYVDANDLNVPVFDGDFRCKNDKAGNCPFEDGVLPDENIGCNYCNMLVENWNMWLECKREFGDQFFQRMYLDLADDDYSRFNTWIASKLGEDQWQMRAAPYYDFMRELFCISGNPINVIPGTQDVQNGRHRLRLAQLMDLNIPVEY